MGVPGAPTLVGDRDSGGIGRLPAKEDLAAGACSWPVFVQEGRNLPRHNRSLGYRIKFSLGCHRTKIPPSVLSLCLWMNAIGNRS